MIEELLKRDDRRQYSVSQYELERRWKAVRQRMAAKGIDYLVIQSQQRFVGGYFLWFTDLHAANFSITAVFPLEDDMTIIGHGPQAPTPPGAPPKWAWRGVKECINVPAFPNVWWEDSWFAEKAVDVMTRNKPKTIGLVGLGNMSAALYENLKKGLSDVEFVNATDIVDEVRMVKSEEELKLHRDAACLHEFSYEIAKEVIAPGKTATEVIEEIRHAQVMAGSEEQQIAITFGPLGAPPNAQLSWGNTRIKKKFQYGDIVNILIESSAAGGYWYDLRRFLYIGKVPDELQKAHSLAIEARRLMAEKMTAGSMPAAALKASDEFLKRNGCPVESRVAAHGQGVDLVERPVIRPEETAALETGMVVSLHPTARTQSAAVCISDTYVIVDSGAIPIYQNLFNDNKIIELC